MSMISRRALITGFASLIAAPAVIRTPGLLMPVKAFDAGWRELGTAYWWPPFNPLFYHDETGHLQSFVNGDINSVPKVWPLVGGGKARHWVAEMRPVA